MRKIVEIYVSTVTGNTGKLADSLVDPLRRMGFAPVVRRTGEVLARSEEGLSGMNDCDMPLLILCFWCRRAGMDDLTLRLLGRLSGRNILAFGTMGSYPDSPYGSQVRENVFRAVRERNHLEGLFLCRGRIDEKRTEKRRKLPADHPHYLTDDAYERHLSSRSHPDEEDLKGARAFLFGKLKEMNMKD